MRAFGRRTAVVALGAALLAAAGCRRDEDTSQPRGAAPSPTPRPDPTALARQAADQLEAQRAFHFVVEHDNGGSPIVLGLLMNRAEGDILRPDRLRADLDAISTQLGNASVKVKVVSVGDRAVITNPFNPRQWVPMPGNNRMADIFDPGAGATAALRSVQNARLAGEETLNGVKVWRIEGEVDASALGAISPIAEPGYSIKGTAWIGQDRPLPYRIRMEGPLGSRDAPTIVRRIELTKFNESITIDLPATS
jgi:hypothetical protein